MELKATALEYMGLWVALSRIHSMELKELTQYLEAGGAGGNPFNGIESTGASMGRHTGPSISSNPFNGIERYTSSLASSLASSSNPFNGIERFHGDGGSQIRLDITRIHSMELKEPTPRTRERDVEV